MLAKQNLHYSHRFLNNSWALSSLKGSMRLFGFHSFHTLKCLCMRAGATSSRLGLNELPLDNLPRYPDIDGLTKSRSHLKA